MKVTGPLVLLVAAGLATGCATEAKYKEIVHSWVGGTADELVMAWGPPDSSYTLSDGGSVLQYERQGQTQVGGYTYMQPQTTYSSGTVNAYGDYGTYSGTSTTYVPVTTPTYNISLICTTRFNVDSTGIIRSTVFEGNNCIAE